MAEQISSYRPLPISMLMPATGYARPFFHVQNPVKAFSSALEVMTDLRFILAGTVSATLHVDAANQKMIARGVRALLVTNEHDDVIGIITSRDLSDERPAAAMQLYETDFQALKVQDVMTAAKHIEVLSLVDVLHARVGDIIETLRHSGRQHALVVEEESWSGKKLIRGIFSASQIARQLGAHAQPHALADTFADIERAIANDSEC